MKDFKELQVWQKSIELCEQVYLFCENLPMDEKFGLISQIKRSVTSIPSNIAEGHRRSSTKDFVRFLRIALGSSAELETQVILIQKLYKLPKQDDILEDILEIQKMLSGLIKSLK